MDPHDSPLQRLTAQAARCRRAWRRLDDQARPALAAQVLAEGRATSAVWVEVLLGRYPLADWLSGEQPLDTLPPVLPGGFSPRQLLHDHPFASLTPWSTLPTCPASSSTPHA